MKKLYLFFLFIVFSNLIVAQNITQQKVKGAYIFNFTKYIEWPEQQKLTEFVIGVYGDDDAMYRELYNSSKNQMSRVKLYNSTKSLPLKVVKLKNTFNPQNIQMLYVPPHENKNIIDIVDRTHNSNTLIITDNCDSMHQIMINFTWLDQGTDNATIGFIINKQNILYEGFKVLSKEILLLGGTELDVAILYKETEQELTIQKKQVEALRKEIDSQLEDIKKQKLLLNEQANQLRSQKEKLDSQKVDIGRQNNLIQNQDIDIKKREKKLKEIQANFEVREKELQNRLKIIRKKETEIGLLEEQIRNHQKVLDSQQSQISTQESQILEQSDQISLQKKTLDKKDDTIKTQQLVLFSSGVILILVIALIFAVLRSYKQKKLSNQQLESKNNQLNHTLEKLRHTQSQLVQSEKMASLGTLTAGIAHEINNPVSFVSVGAYSLKNNFEQFVKIVEEYDKVDLGEEARTQIEEIKEEIEYDEIKQSIEELIDDVQLGANRTTQIVKGLRNFSRLDESDFKPANINEGLDSTLLLLRNKVQDKIEIIREYDTIPDIECYAGQLNQVFMNIINNAIDAINGEGGQITITTVNLQDHIAVHIQDNGSGMPPHVVEKIFDPFFTTKEVGKGTGLGLSISFGIIQKHNGDVKVKSSANKGTEFIITLPKSSKK